MSRAILQACAPCLVALVAAFGVLLLICVTSKATWNWNRFRDLHRCQRGGVQSLSFVLTLPVFTMIVLFIIQVSQLMTAMVIVHYAAFAGARSASVWLPAQLVPDPICPPDEDPLSCDMESDFLEVANRLSQLPTSTDNLTTKYRLSSADISPKLIQIRKAVIMGCAPLAPSRDLGYQPVSADIANTIPASQQMYSWMVPASQQNPRISKRIANKLSYADNNTDIELKWFDSNDPYGTDSLDYRSYNPRAHPNPMVRFRPNEIGWQDPLTVTVWHRFALLPGPGRFLAKQLVDPRGLPDNISPQIQRDSSGQVYTVVITATATAAPECIKSVRPYVQPQ